MSKPVQALVVIDLQRGLLTGPQAVVGAAALTDRVEQLIHRAAAAGALVVQRPHPAKPSGPARRSPDRPPLR